MAELYVSKSIDIKATPQQVWQVLTDPLYTSQWASAFGATKGLDSSWEMGEEVVWKDDAGQPYVKGTITAFEPYKLLRFTVYDLSMKKPKMSETDGITYSLADKQGRTMLSVVHGDFGKVQNGDEYYKATLTVWKKVLPKIKRIAERLASQASVEKPTLPLKAG